MVYCGKPSKGCQMCRTRRIKCDETKPTCNQCAKSRRQCPGYKDEFDLVFRNETQATERRARKASRKASVQKKVKSDSSSPKLQVSPVFANGIKSSLEQAVIPALGIPVDHQASCHFVSNFILVPQGGSTRGFMDFVIPLLKEKSQGHLQHAFNACSMAFLSNRAGTGGRFADKALHEYTKALNETNAALRDPERQLADSTLTAVLLLGLFESISAKQIGMLNWGSHTEGAIQLVKARGKKQLKTKVGLTIFIAVRTQMIIHSLTSGTAPINGPDWWIDDAVRDGTAAKCHRLMIKTGELRAAVTRLMNSMARTPANIDVMLDMIRRLQTVDREVVAWMRNVPEDWRFRTVAWEDRIPGGDYARAEVFPGRIDIYRDFYIASVWNTSRTARLVLASLVVRCAAWVCAPVDYRTTPEYATAARTCVDTITDVIASVPYHLGWHLQASKRHVVQEAAAAHFGAGAFACGQEDSVKALAGYWLTWPLICMNSMDYTTDAQRAWIHGRLRYIGNELGVRYAHILSRLRIRIPSMLIRRDGLMATPYGAAAHDYLKIASMGRQESLSPAQLHTQTQSMAMQAQMQAQAQTLAQMQTQLQMPDQGWQAYAPTLPPALSAGVHMGQAQTQQVGGIADVSEDGGTAGAASSNSGDPLQHAEALQKERFEQHGAELLARAAGGQNAGENQRWVARRLLTV
ncbi:hypothetical protein GGR54DRAFT_418216 [Hypoxylon sp. NC1633]|nr:hypothetical protein GGR54DRAFT_418216 [Hypoxylon sp. NC1633]